MPDVAVRERAVLVRLETCGRGLDCIGNQPVVRVEEQEELPGARRQTVVARVAEISTRTTQILRLRIVGDNAIGVVCGFVVDDDQFDIGVGLSKHAFD